jgi:uncharacterized RDD family membrane protein YckC
MTGAAPTYNDLEGRTAGFVSRLIAFSIDVVIVVVTIGILTWVVGQIEVLFEEFLPRDLRLQQGFAFAIPFIVALYFIGFWALTGSTIGKWVLGLRVVRADGSPPTTGRSAIRFVGYLISAIVFFLGFIWVLFDEERRAWHDDLAGTWVVYDFRRRPQGAVFSHKIEGAEADGTEIDEP